MGELGDMSNLQPAESQEMIIKVRVSNWGVSHSQISCKGAAPFPGPPSSSSSPPCPNLLPIKMKIKKRRPTM